jgi:hypothetical protein
MMQLEVVQTFTPGGRNDVELDINIYCLSPHQSTMAERIGLLAGLCEGLDTTREPRAVRSRRSHMSTVWDIPRRYEARPRQGCVEDWTPQFAIPRLVNGTDVCTYNCDVVVQYVDSDLKVIGGVAIRLSFTHPCGFGPRNPPGCERHSRIRRRSCAGIKESLKTDPGQIGRIAGSTHPRNRAAAVPAVGTCCDCDAERVLARLIAGGVSVQQAVMRRQPSSPAGFGLPVEPPSLLDCGGDHGQVTHT